MVSSAARQRYPLTLIPVALLFELSPGILLIPNQVFKRPLSGAALAFAAFLMILPGFLTDAIGLLIIFPWTRKLLFKKFSKKKNNKNFIEGEYEDIDENK